MEVKGTVPLGAIFEGARSGTVPGQANSRDEVDPRSINLLNVTRDNLDLCASWRGYAENRGGGQLGHRQ